MGYSHIYFTQINLDGLYGLVYLDYHLLFGSGSAQRVELFPGRRLSARGDKEDEKVQQLNLTPPCHLIGTFPPSSSVSPVSAKSWGIQGVSLSCAPDKVGERKARKSPPRNLDSGASSAELFGFLPATATWCSALTLHQLCREHDISRASHRCRF